MSEVLKRIKPMIKTPPLRGDPCLQQAAVDPMYGSLISASYVLGIHSTFATSHCNLLLVLVLPYLQHNICKKRNARGFANTFCAFALFGCTARLTAQDQIPR